MSGQVVENLERVGAPVVARIEALLSGEVARWEELHPSLADPLSALTDFVMAGGKRLRPSFCYWAFVGAGGDPLDMRVVDAGAALELLHSFALIHDDVMDDSTLRRGADSIHVRFNKEHTTFGLAGEARRYGEGVAILIGDMAFVYADKLMNSTSQEAIQVFAELRVELNIGQFLDISATAHRDVSLPMAQKITQFKSGKYTIERPMHIGAALAGRFNELGDQLSNYGIPVGEAFQLRDDLLDAFGETDVIGKKIGGDIREGKPTALVAAAMSLSSPRDASFLAEHYGEKDIEVDIVSEIQRIFISSGAKEQIETSIDTLTESGLRALDEIDITDEAKTQLAGLAEYLAGRHS